MLFYGLTLILTSECCCLEMVALLICFGCLIWLLYGVSFNSVVCGLFCTVVTYYLASDLFCVLVLLAVIGVACLIIVLSYIGYVDVLLFAVLVGWCLFLFC